MNITQHLKNKIDQRIFDLFDKAHTNDDIDNINIRDEIVKKLHPYQILHTFNLITALKNNNCIVDGSSTGTGKTYTAIATCAQLNLLPIIICPKNVISSWINIVNLFNVKSLLIVNYEAIRSLNCLNQNNEIIPCTYITKQKDFYIWNFNSLSLTDQKRVVFIFDEAQKCKNHNSLNAKLLISTKKYKTMLLSATICDKLSDFGIFGMMLRFYNNHEQGKKWIQSVIREDKNQYGVKKNSLHRYLFPSKGSKMSLDDLGDAFPMNQISVECYDLSAANQEKINDYYRQIDNKLNNGTIPGNQLIKLNSLRQKIENLKSSLIIDMMVDYYEHNKSVCIFVNYKSSLRIIIDYLKKKGIMYAEIHGDQSIDVRKHNIDSFQTNQVRIIVCTIGSGGMAISLNDTIGLYPRVSLISPNYSGIDLVQTLGRISRTDTKSPCLQKIIFCANTCEANVAAILKQKKDMLDKITDEELNFENTMSKQKQSNERPKTS
jgi:SNF2 family DNA or RNA helicase